MRGRKSTANLPGVRRDDVVPVCPHFEAELPEVHVRKVRRPFGIALIAGSQRGA